MSSGCCRSLSWLVAAACFVVVTGCDKAAPEHARPKVPPREVEVVTPEPRPMERVIAVSGTLAAHEKSVLSAKVSGRLERIMVDIGSRVKQGDLLAQIEPKDYQLGLQQAEAALAEARAAIGLPPEGTDDRVTIEQISSVKQAKAVLEEATKNQARVRSLNEAGIASTSELDTVDAAYTVALTRYQVAVEDAGSRIAAVAQRRAELELARKRLADTALRAPFDGTVQSRPAGTGQFVTAGTPTVELVKSDPLRLRLEVPERSASMIQAGQTVRLQVEGDTNVYTGTLTRLAPALNEENRTLLVEADVPSQGTLRPGLFARAQIVIIENEPALSVPAESLTTFAGLEKVVVVEGGKAVEKVVTTGRRREGWVEVVSGLGGQEQVIMNPEGLRTGNPVLVVPKNRTFTAVPAEGYGH